MKSLFFQFVALSIICILIVYSQKYRCIEQFTQTVKFDDDIYKVVKHTHNHVNTLNDTIDINYSEILNQFCKKRSFFKIDMKGIDLNEKRELIIKSKTSLGVVKNDSKECVSKEDSFNDSLDCPEIECLSNDLVSDITVVGSNINNEHCVYEQCADICKTRDDNCWIQKDDFFHKISKLDNCQFNNFDSKYDCLKEDELQCNPSIEYVYKNPYDIHSLTSNIIKTPLSNYDQNNKICDHRIYKPPVCEQQSNTSIKCFYNKNNSFHPSIHHYNFNSCSFESNVGCIQELSDENCTSSNNHYIKIDDYNSNNQYIIQYEQQIFGEGLVKHNSYFTCEPKYNTNIPECKYNKCYSYSNDSLTKNTHYTDYNLETDQCVFDDCYNKNDMITYHNIQIDNKIKTNQNIINNIKYHYDSVENFNKKKNELSFERSNNINMFDKKLSEINNTIQYHESNLEVYL